MLGFASKLFLLLSIAIGIECGKVGILYEGWHVEAASAYRKISQIGKTLNVEQVIRSNGQYTLNDILNKYNMGGEAGNFYYQTEPQAGYYCIWRKRSDDHNPRFPDCPNITSTLTRHAHQLTSANVDFVVVDSTNIPVDEGEGDWLQLRPIEILFEEWHALRSQGIMTPNITVWPTITPGATLWQTYINIYKNSSYANMIQRDNSGRPIMFVVPNNADPKIIDAIKTQGVTVVEMWAQLSQSTIDTGMWQFFATCNNNGKEMTSSIVGTQCNEYCTPNSPIGSQCTASPSFQIQYGSLPFGAPGRLSGLTFKQQFSTIFKNQPDYVFISSWNEFIAQPQPNPYSNVVDGFSMGLPNDPMGRDVWVDTYGAEYGRDIEPSVEYGSYYYDLMSSCLRIYKSGARSCQDEKEECCQMQKSEIYVNVFSLRKNSGDDFLLTIYPNEVETLVNSGQWSEICSPFPGSSIFCQDRSNLNGQYGSFITYSVSRPESRPLYRCEIPETNQHFFSPDSNCEGYKMEFQIGFVSTVRRGDSLRGLYRCRDGANNAHYSSLDVVCPNGDHDAGLIGYVR
eukprot:TRINITY_DN563_c0_g1_i1.p1 TRINITY_DN563_c0_g1~~TRINITY_DN563_c0_g1_i1.p1  ORF type:complete len:568 (+),score=158.68 TRINITY_DN563_c0_g1_i1:15-1718(+)